MVDTKLRAVVTADTSGYKKGMAEAKKATEGFGKTQEKARETTQRFGQEVEDTAEPMTKAETGAKGWKAALNSLSPTLGGFGSAVDEYREKVSKANDDGSIGFKAFKAAGIAALAAVALKMGQVAFQFASETAQMFDSNEYSKALEEREVGLKKFKTAIGGFLAPLVNAINSGLGKLFKALASAFEHIYAGIFAVYTFFKTLLQPAIDAVAGAFSSLASMFGKTKGEAEQAASGVEDIGKAAEYAQGGLQGFDKINVMDGLTGDKKTAEDMTSMADAWGKSAAGFAEHIKEIVAPLGKIGDFFKNLSFDSIWESIKNGGRSAWDYVKTSAGSAWNWIAGKATGTWAHITGAGRTAWDGIKGFGTSTWNTIANIGTTVWGHITGFFMMTWENLTSGIRGAWEGAMAYARGIGQTFAKLLTGDFSGAWETITGTFKSLWDGVTNWLRGVFERLFGWIQGVIDSIMASVRWVTDKVDGAKNAVKDFGGKVVGGIKGALGIGAATGDVIRPNDGLQYRIVGDNKRETEVISPLSTMKAAMKEAMTEMGSGAGSTRSQPMDITLNINGKKLARLAFDDFQTVARQKGRGSMV